ncbi:phosphoesterase [Parapedobacter pyrenivorans]|uniref:Phosphoesterase n=1 Tax=Parapedobacter pyrenivorans TaxID=1305674 RepID=A0A917M994_9SPHI|nr:metallophosphoesterase family protein [Parapedobacter pyrenivorans]GGG85562.1 phosphoesterase [Parapedobacter pyrenivorans]
MIKYCFTIISCLFFAATGSFSQTLDQGLTDSIPRRIILNVTEDLATSVAINWQTACDVKESFAEIAIADADPRFVEKAIRKKAETEGVSLGDTVSANYHSLVFDNLIPNTKYAYRVGQGNHWSEWFHFVTASDQPTDSFQFIYFGDVQVNIRSLWSRVIREAFAKAPNARLQLYAGDIINRANRDEEWADWFAAGGFIHSMIPGLPSPGNHDHFNLPNGDRAASVFWRPQFNLPLNGPKGLEETCYFVDVQGVRFISLNSDQAEESDQYLEAQRVWLERVLADNPNTWTVITFHHPIYSPKGTRDNQRMRETFKPLFDRYGVDLVLQGHDHTYARGMSKIPMDGRGKTSGTMYVVSVSGPKMTGSHVEKKSWMDRSAIYTQLFQIVDVSPQKLSFKAYLATGELYDAFDLIKQEGTINKLVDRVPDQVPERQ